MQFTALAFALIASAASGGDGYALQGREVGAIRKSNLATWSLPFDKSWEALTEEQRQVVRSAYENMPSTDEPPYPLNGMRDLAKGVAEIQLRANVSGQLSGAIRIDEFGNGQHIELFQSPLPEKMNKAVAFLYMKEKYKPARCSGKPCAMDFPIGVTLEGR